MIVEYTGVLIFLLLLLTGCASSLPVEDGAVAEGSNRQFYHSVSTTASAEDIWLLWTDVSTWPSWDTELDGASLEGAFREGAKGTVTQKEGRTSKFRITEVENRSTYTMETSLPLGKLRIRRSMIPVENGDTIQFTHEVSFHGLGGRLLSGQLGPRFRQQLPIVMEQLKTMAEEKA